MIGSVRACPPAASGILIGGYCGGVEHDDEIVILNQVAKCLCASLCNDKLG